MVYKQSLNNLIANKKKCMIVGVRKQIDEK